MPASKPGCTLRLNDDEALGLLTALYEEGAIQFIQVQAIPLPRRSFREHLDRIQPASRPSSTHPTTYGVNLRPRPGTTVRSP